MNTRRKLVIAFGASALSAPLGFAQQSNKIPLVGVLHPGSPSAPGSNTIPAALRQSLRALGYVEGKSIAIQYRWGHGKPDTLPHLALDLVKRAANVLIAVSVSSINAAKAAGAIPIVATDLQVDPVATGLAASLARPGNNVTGLFLDFPSMMGKWVELLREVVPKMRRATVLWDANTGSSQLDALAIVAKSVGIELEVAKFQQAGDIETVLSGKLQRRPQAVIQLSSPIVNQASDVVAKLMGLNRLPAISMFSAFPEAGGLMSFGPDLAVFWQRLGPLVEKILKGTKPSVIPIERPTTFEMILNLKAAMTLGITIPPTIMVQATRVIQ